MSSEPQAAFSFAERIAQLAESDGTSPVLRVVAVDGAETVVTWPELHRRSTQIARALQERGTTEGARVAVALRNSAEFVMTVVLGVPSTTVASKLTLPTAPGASVPRFQRSWGGFATQLDVQLPATYVTCAGSTSVSWTPVAVSVALWFL